MTHEYVISRIEDNINNLERVISSYGLSNLAHNYDYYARGFLDALSMCEIISNDERKQYIDKLESLFKE